MRKTSRRDADSFSLAFLDIIACGFGAIVLLLLIVKPDSPQGTSLIENTTIKDLFSLQGKSKSLNEELAKLDETQSELQGILSNAEIDEAESFKNLISSVDLIHYH